MNDVEHIMAAGQPLAIIIRAGIVPLGTTFYTPPEYPQQVGFVVYPAGGAVARHAHLPLDRHLTGTSEVIVVRSGRCELDVFDDDQRLVDTRVLGPGDVMVMVGGGHAFRMLEDTVLLEVKQGPYTGDREKRLF